MTDRTSEQLDKKLYAALFAAADCYRDCARAACESGDIYLVHRNVSQAIALDGKARTIARTREL